MDKFKFTRLEVPDIILIESTVFNDARGYFMEYYNKEAFEAAGLRATFVQDNQSVSARGILRGLHFQTRRSQGKLVRVIQGRVFDVGVDLRPGSPTFGQWAGAVLDEDNKHQLYVPEGFAHGYMVLSDKAVFTYKCTDVYDPGHEGGVIWNDKDLAINWPDPGAPLLLSDKDQRLPAFAEQDFSYFEKWR